MADRENQNKYETSESSDQVEIKDRGVFDFIGKKKEEEPEQQDVILTEFEKVKVSEEPEKKEAVENKHTLLDQLHRSNSSSSDEEAEVGEGGEKKKGLKEKILNEKIEGDGEKQKKEQVDTSSVPVDAAAHNEEKKCFLGNIKEKLPGHKKTEEVATPSPPPPAASSEYGQSTTTTTAAADVAHHEAEAKEKKGLLEKIKEKLPGHHSKTEEDKEKESAAH